MSDGGGAVGRAKALFALALFLPIAVDAAQKPSSAGGAPVSRISKSASESCAAKVKAMEDFAAEAKPRKGKKTRFSEEEINSYLELELKAKYHPSLRSLVLTFGEGRLKGLATLDLDNLNMNSTKFMARILAKLLTGVHELALDGRLIAAEGKGRFSLEEARFDSSTLPNFLVEEIISSVGKKQKPPFDPMQPSELPYRIQKVEIRRGYLLVVQ